MRYTFSVGSYLGIPVRVHFTFPLILLIFGGEAWARGGVLDGVRSVGLILAVFVCVVLHEFGHSIQVRRYGIRVRDIILLPIGGMARAERIPEKPWQEIVVAISGPAVNFVLAGLFFGIMWLRGDAVFDTEGFLANMLFINIVLGVFNLVPAFPMDGGRILRALLALRFPYLKATRQAKAVGQIIALAFVVIGFLNSAFLMLPVIAVFIFFGAMSEEQMIKVRVCLEDKIAGDLVDGEQRLFSLADPIESVVSGARSGTLAVPVSDPERTVTGAVTITDATAAVRDGRGDDPVSSIVRFDFPVFRADTPAVQTYYFLKSEKKRYAGVMSEGVYLGLAHFDSFLDESR